MYLILTVAMVKGVITFSKIARKKKNPKKHNLHNFKPKMVRLVFHFFFFLFNAENIRFQLLATITYRLIISVIIIVVNIIFTVSMMGGKETTLQQEQESPQPRHDK